MGLGRGRKKIKPKGYLVWGKKKGSTKGGRQLGSSRKKKSDAEKIARDHRKKGYVAHVQVTYRTPKK